MGKFQSTRPHKPRRCVNNHMVSKRTFQSTRPHKPRQQKHTTNTFKPLSQRHYYTTSLKIYHYIITIYLPNPLLFTKNWCESPGKFMCTSDLHPPPLPYCRILSLLLAASFNHQPYTSHSSLHIFHPITAFLFPL